MSQRHIYSSLKNMHAIRGNYTNELLYESFSSLSCPDDATTSVGNANEYTATVGVANYKIVRFRMYVFAILLTVLRLLEGAGVSVTVMIGTVACIDCEDITVSQDCRSYERVSRVPGLSATAFTCPAKRNTVANTVAVNLM